MTIEPNDNRDDMTSSIKVRIAEFGILINSKMSKLNRIEPNLLYSYRENR